MIVYCIKNKINGKEYVGLTKRTLEKRWKQHIYESNKKDSWECNTLLGNAIKKYGQQNFDIFILEKCENLEQLKEKEIKFIEERKTFFKQNGYNMTKGGDGRLGIKHSEETKIKIGLGQIGKKMNSEARLKCSLAKRSKYKRGSHPKAVKLIINDDKIFNCIRDFSEAFGIPCSTLNNKFRKGLREFFLDGIKIQRIYE